MGNNVQTNQVVVIDELDGLCNVRVMGDKCEIERVATGEVFTGRNVFGMLFIDNPYNPNETIPTGMNYFDDAPVPVSSESNHADTGAYSGDWHCPDGQCGPKNRRSNPTARPQQTSVEVPGYVVKAIIGGAVVLVIAIAASALL